MPEYIEREALLSELQEEIEFETSMYTEEQNKYFNMGLKCAIRDVKSQSAADVVEVKHGKWLNFYGDYYVAECSVCGEIYDVIQPCEYCNQEWWDIVLREYRYCPKCGAKMDGKEYTNE